MKRRRFLRTVAEVGAAAGGERRRRRDLSKPHPRKSPVPAIGREAGDEVGTHRSWSSFRRAKRRPASALTGSQKDLAGGDVRLHLASRSDVEYVRQGNRPWRRAGRFAAQAS
jgi:hypothetical protein